MNKPPLGITAKVDFISNYDGDTIDIEFKQKIKIRVTNEIGNFDTPEKGYRAQHNAERYLSNLAESRTRELLSNAEIHIHIPDAKPGELGTSFAVGTRIAGIVYFRVNNEWYDLSQVLTNEELTKYHANILHDLEQTYLSGNVLRIDNMSKEEVYRELKMKVGQFKNDYRLNSCISGGNFVNYINTKYTTQCSELIFIKGFEKSYLAIL